MVDDPHHWRSGYIPKTKMPKSTVTQWSSPESRWHIPYGSDTHGRFMELQYTNWPYQNYGPDDISYEMNSYGYRSIEPDPSSPHKKIMFVGCSFTFGDGLPYAHNWTTRTVEGLKAHYGIEIEQHNFGNPGHSNASFAQVVHQVLPVLKPDLLVVLFTELSRRSYFRSALDRAYLTVHRQYDPEFKAYIQLQNDDNDFFDFVKQWNMIDLSAQVAGIPWVWQGLCSFHNKKMTDYVRADNSVPRFPDYQAMNDFARDGSHPGPISNGQFADAMVNHIIERKIFK